MAFANISAQDFLQLINSGMRPELIDVRTPPEFRDTHIEFATNIPLDRLDPIALSQSRGTSTAPLYVVCQSGGRSKQACERLVQGGIANVVNVDGGTAACIAAGLPIVRGEKSISLERQVRIAAGSLVLLGILLGVIHPLGIALSAFVGVGLVFAGITNTCGMGMLLARMPWNKIAAA